MNPSSPRLASLDQFRGYTVAGMFLVNFLGGYDATPALLRHHNTWCSYADTIMPQFFFAVGMALRLVTQRETQQHGRSRALRRGGKRGLLLVLIGFLWYHPGRDFSTSAELTGTPARPLLRDLFLTNAFQALTHIGVVTLWVLPVMTCGWRVRTAFALGSAALHLWWSHAFWYQTLHEWHVIDGGPLGFLTWTLPVVAGSTAYDAVKASGPGLLRRLGSWAAGLMAAGYALACATQGGNPAAPPFMAPWHAPDLWTMSQKAGSVSYLLFASGFSLVAYAFFVFWTDRRGCVWSVFSTLGQNALAAYLIHMVVLGFLGHVAPRDAPLWYALTLSAIGCLLSLWAVQWCNARKLILRL